VRTYVIRRLLGAIPLLLAISMITFGLMSAAPGGPLARLQENPKVRPEDIEIKRKLLGLDKPMPVRYAIWLKKTVTGDFGESYVTNEPVLGMIAQRLPATLELMLTSFFLSLILGLGIGIWTALRRATLVDYVATFLSFVGISLPVFWFGLMAQVVFGVWLGWLPVTGRFSQGEAGTVVDYLRHLVLPVVVLSLLYTASWSRFMRSSLIEVMSQDYVRTAWAKGLPRRRVVFRHGVRNALIPIVTVMAIQVPGLFTGAIITEAIFAWPGMGRLFYDGIQKGDYPRLMAILMISSTLIVLFNLIADVLYGVLDPRISFK
jgi:peptide/nickel transport system permease protein